MALRINVAHTVLSAVKALNQVGGKDLQFATRTAVNKTAFQARAALTKELQTKLKNPIPGVYKAYRYRGAKNIAEPVAVLYVVRRQIPLIRSITVTGENLVSRITRDARAEGIIKGDEVLTPTRAVRKRNSYGNVGRPPYRRFRDTGAKVRGSRKTKAGVFYGGGADRAKVLIATNRPRKYTVRVDADGFVKRFVAKTMPRLFKEAYQKNVARTVARAVRLR